MTLQIGTSWKRTKAKQKRKKKKPTGEKLLDLALTMISFIASQKIRLQTQR